MRELKKAFTIAIACSAYSLAGASIQAFAAVEPEQGAQTSVVSSKSEASSATSSATHAVDLVPYFDEPLETPVHKEERTARTQIKDAGGEARRAEANNGPLNAVMESAKQKNEVVKESTDIMRDESAKSINLTREQLARPTVALALGGGGSRGAAHIGVLRELEKAGIPIDFIVGNSMGAIVGGLYASGVPLDKIELMLTSGALRHAYMPGGVPPKLLVYPLEKLMHPFKKHYAGLWTGKKYGEFLEAQLPRRNMKVQDTKVHFSAVATNLIDGKAYRISDGNLSTAIRASSTLPTLLQPVAIGDKVFVDGGLRANLPASAARDTGADIVIAVLVDEPIKVLPPSTFQHLHGIAQRLTDIMLAVSDSRQLPFADIVITPDVSKMSILKSTAPHTRRAIASGAAAADKALPAIRKLLNIQSAEKRVATENGISAN